MKKSESIKEIAKALAQLQAIMPAVPMNAINPFLKNKFADLGAVISTLRPLLSKYGLSYTQLPYSENGRVGVVTVIMHESGEWIESDVSIEVEEEKGKSAAQVAGSIITYLRRYSLTAAFGMYAEEDSDGNVPRTKSDEIITDKLWQRWLELVASAESVGVKYPVVNRAEITASELKRIGAEIKEYVEQAEKQKAAGEQ